MTKSSARHPADDEFGPESPEDIMEDLRAVVRDAEELLRSTEGQVGERVEELRARVEDTLAEARGRLEGAAGARGQRIRAAAQSTENYVKENPWTALIIAIGAGYLVGLVGRAARRR